MRLSLTLPVDVRPDEALPVMVWIHGGSYVFGAGDSPLFDPTVLVREERVIVVRVTYRLGLFGFLGSGAGRPANLGLLDQIEALRWVQRNIAAFGGDPANVTAFGESAGGDAIAHLMIAEGTEGLFRRAIIQSAPLGISLGRGPMSAVMALEAALVPSDATADVMLEAQARIEKRVKGFGLTTFMPFGVQYGLPPLPPEHQVDAAWERAASKFEVLIGTNEREAAFFTVVLPPLDKALSQPVAGPLVEHGFVKPITWQVYASAVPKFSARHRRGGGRGYSYTFTWRTPDPVFAAAHIAELPLLFENQAAWGRTRLVAGAPWSEIEEKGKTLRGIWASFARTGTAPSGSIDGLIDIRPM
jgi:para-nitrobenzyl esterase